MVVLSETLHFGKAADICGVAQPSLSATVKKVEAVLGCQLFDRSTRRSALTQKGEEVAKAAQAVLNLLDSSMGSGVLTGAKVRFRLGMIPTVGPYFVKHVVPLVLQADEGLELVVVEATTAELEAMVLERSVDLAVVSLPIDDPAMELKTLYQERLVLAVSRRHAMAGRESVGMDELDLERLLVLDQGHCLRAQTLEACGSSQVKDKPVHAVGLPTLLGMVAAGAGYTLLPESAAEWAFFGGEIALVPFQAPEPSRTVALMGLRSRHRQTGRLAAAISGCMPGHEGFPGMGTVPRSG